MAGIARIEGRFDNVITEHLKKLRALDESGFVDVKRDIGNYLVDDARANILAQRLFDGSAMLQSKNADAHSYHRVGQNGKAKGKKFKVNVKARLVLQDTARLRDSYTFDENAGSHELVVGSAVEYAAIHHFGGRTSAHLIVAKNKKALRTPFGLFKSVYHPGSHIPARPVLGVATRQALYIGNLISHAIEAIQ